MRILSTAVNFLTDVPIILIVLYFHRQEYLMASPSSIEDDGNFKPPEQKLTKMDTQSFVEDIQGSSGNLVGQEEFIA